MKGRSELQKIQAAAQAGNTVVTSPLKAVLRCFSGDSELHRPLY